MKYCNHSEAYDQIQTCGQLHLLTYETIKTCGTKYSRVDQVKLVKTAFKKFEGIWSV